MSSWLLITPITFVVVLISMMLLLKLLGLVSAKTVKPSHDSGKLKSYACGEDVKNNRIAPDYSEFFPFAFFFTIMHVLALVVVTVPAGSLSATVIAIGYASALAIGLFILFRRQ
jgi:NADH:ubiquinone oxidoreductase subunit 3 (subunit A)